MTPKIYYKTFFDWYNKGSRLESLGPILSNLIFSKIKSIENQSFSYFYYIKNGTQKYRFGFAHLN